MSKRFNAVTSGKKISKAMRKLAQAQFTKRFKQIEAVVKPKPRWVPTFLWRWLLNLVVNTKVIDKK